MHSGEALLLIPFAGLIHLLLPICPPFLTENRVTDLTDYHDSGCSGGAAAAPAQTLKAEMSRLVGRSAELCYSTSQVVIICTYINVTKIQQT